MNEYERQAAVAGAPGTIDLNGQTYVVYPPSDQDAQAIGKFLREHAKRTALREVTAQLQSGEIPPEFRAEAIKAAVALDASGGVAPSQRRSVELLNSLAGCQFMAWVMIRKAHPDVTREQLAKLITEENYEQVYEDLNRASGMGSLGN